MNLEINYGWRLIIEYRNFNTITNEEIKIINVK
jgi:hypothetical protein